MSWQATNWAVAQKTGSPGRKVILLLLANLADEEHSCFPGQERLAQESEQSVSTVYRHLKAMEDLGLISREHRTRDYGSGGRTSDRYFLHVDGVRMDTHGYAGASDSAEVSGQNDGLGVSGQDAEVSGQIGEGIRSPMTEEPLVEPSVVEPLVHADAAAPTQRHLVPVSDTALVRTPTGDILLSQASAQTLVAAWVDGYQKTNPGVTPDPTLMRRVVGQCRDFAKAREGQSEWQTAIQAAYIAGIQGWVDPVKAIQAVSAARAPQAPSRFKTKAQEESEIIQARRERLAAEGVKIPFFGKG